VNKFPIWSLFSYEYYSYANKFHICTSCLYEHFPYVNILNKQFSYKLIHFWFFLIKNNSPIWTIVLYEHLYYVNNLYKTIIIWINTIFFYKICFYIWTSLLCEQFIRTIILYDEFGFYEHFYYVNNFHIWIFFSYEQYSYTNKFNIWTFFLCDQVSYMNIFSIINIIRIWTFSLIWTCFIYALFHIQTNLIHE
jgi:hypothetical protein